MKRLSCALFAILSAELIFAGPLLAQQPAQPSGPPYTTPPTFPENQAPAASVPPDTKAPSQAPAQSLSTAQVKQQILEKLKTEPELSNAPVSAKVTDRSVVLKGSVDNERQHDLAVRIAQSYAGGRAIVDRIKVRQAS
jgi:BON domain